MLCCVLCASSAVSCVHATLYPVKKLHVTCPATPRAQNTVQSPLLCFDAQQQFTGSDRGTVDTYVPASQTVLDGAWHQPDHLLESTAAVSCHYDISQNNNAGWLRMQRNECHTRPKQQPTLFARSCNQHTCCMQAADNQADARRRERRDAHCSTHEPTEARVTQAMNA